MPPKRKSKASSSPAKKTKGDSGEATSKTELVNEVVQQLQPIIAKAVQDAVASSSHVSSSSGDIDNENHDEDLEVLFRDTDTAIQQDEPENFGTIYLHVPKSIADKIKRDEYITLSELINQDDQDISLNITNSGNVTVNKKAKQVKFATCEQWFSAFLIYASIYQEQFPEKACQLFQYMAIVQGLNKSFGIEAAVKYDEDYRKMRSRFPSMRWDKLQQEIYLLAASRSVHKSHKLRSQAQPFRKIPYCPQGFCRQFNQQGACTWDKCIYKHECYKCHGEHASRTCHSNEDIKQGPKHLSKSKPKNLQ